jgi:hypothetical protein
MEARTGQRIAQLAAVAQIPGALGAIDLGPQADRGHPGDSHHVVGTELEPVQRLVDGLPGAVEVAAAAAQLAQQRAVHADPLRLGADRHQPLGLGQSGLGVIIVALA